MQTSKLTKKEINHLANEYNKTSNYSETINDVKNIPCWIKWNENNLLDDLYIIQKH